MYVPFRVVLFSPNAPPASLVVQSLYEQAHEYSNLANRVVPIPTDVLLACDDRGLKGKDLHNIALAARSASQYWFHWSIMY